MHAQGGLIVSGRNVSWKGGDDQDSTVLLDQNAAPEAVGFNDLTWLGWPGWFHSNEMRVEERFTRVGNTLRYDVTVHDPAVLMESWVADTRVLQIDQSTAPYLEDPPCLDFDSAHMVTRERG